MKLSVSMLTSVLGTKTMKDWNGSWSQDWLDEFACRPMGQG